MTREKFISAYVDECRALYAWAADPEKRAGFASVVNDTLSAKRGASWAWDAPASRAAFRKIGGRGPFTLKALRALPAEAKQ